MDQQNNAASELVQDLSRFPAPSEVFVLTKVRPGSPPKEFRFRVALLLGFEEFQVLKAAQEFAREVGELNGYGDIYKEAQAYEVAARCLVAEEPYERPDGTTSFHRIFTSADQVRNNLCNSEVAQILNAYEVVKAKYNGIMATSSGDVDEWLKQLGDELMGPSFLSHLDSSLWGPLLLLCAQRLATVTTGQSAPSTSQDSGESDQQNSGPGTGSFTELPATHYEPSGKQLPRDRLLRDLDAAEFAEELDKP